MLIQHLTTDLNFPSYMELMLAAISGTAAGTAVLFWIDHHANRNSRGKNQALDLRKRTAR
jgi:hypothetical protein